MNGTSASSFENTRRFFIADGDGLADKIRVGAVLHWTRYRCGQRRDRLLCRFANQPHKEHKLDSDKNFRQCQFQIRGQDFNADFCFGFLDLIQQRADQRLILRQPLQAHKGVAAAIRRENERRERFNAVGDRQTDGCSLVRRERVNRLHKAEIFLCRQARRLPRE